MESDIKKRKIRIVGLDRLTDDREDKNGNRRVRDGEIRVPINGSRRVRDAEIRVPIVRGSIAFHLGKKATEQQTHKWSVYVRGATNEDLGVVIKQVIFKLHPSFDNSTRVVDSPPFIISEYGWGEFKIGITIFLHTTACETKVELSHYSRLNSEENYGHKSLKRPVIVESFNEIVFPDPFESFIARVHNHPAVWISKLPKGFNVPPPGITNTYHPTKKGDTKDHPLSKWFFRFSEAKELSKIRAARQQVQVQIAKLKQQLDGGVSEDLLPYTTTMNSSIEKVVDDAS